MYSVPELMTARKIACMKKMFICQQQVSQIYEKYSIRNILI